MYAMEMYRRLDPTPLGAYVLTGKIVAPDCSSCSLFLCVIIYNTQHKFLPILDCRGQVDSKASSMSLYSLSNSQRVVMILRKIPWLNLKLQKEWLEQ